MLEIIHNKQAEKYSEKCFTPNDMARRRERLIMHATQKAAMSFMQKQQGLKEKHYSSLKLDLSTFAILEMLSPLEREGKDFYYLSKSMVKV